MNVLIWKEWRENRLIVVWAGLLTLVLAVGAISLTFANRSYMGRSIDVNTLDLCINFIWCLSALLCSSAMMAPEIGSGSLQFLSALPISRRRIWWTKLIVCFGVLALSVLVATAIYAIIFAYASHAGLLRPTMITVGADLAQQAPVLLVTLPLCAIGMLVTMLLDRTISALMTCLIASVVVYTLIFGVVSLPGTPWYNSAAAWWVLGGLCVPIFLGVSYQTFLHGETLRTSARFKVAVPAFLQSAAIIIAALVIAYVWILA